MPTARCAPLPLAQVPPQPRRGCHGRIAAPNANSVPTNSRCREAVRRPQNVRFCSRNRRVASIVRDGTFLLSWRNE